MDSSTSSASLIDIISETKISRPKAITTNSKIDGLSNTPIKKESDKDRIRKLVDDLESIRTNLEDSKGQGYLFTASHILLTYLERA